ncbi:hypothetical protein NKH77_08565 [Streptomyces sp. M19]
MPAATAADREAARAALGVSDAVPVTGEPYRDWVLEDAFAGPRPPWELDGALFVPDVRPHQLTKLRLLSGCHSALAYLGTAAGRTTVAEAMETGWGERLVRALCAEVAPTLPAGGPDPAGYADDLVERFRNHRIRHLLRQIGSDGSLKIPERWCDALRSCARRAPPPRTRTRPRRLGERHPPRRGRRPTTGMTDPTTATTESAAGMTDPAAAALADCWRAAPDPRERPRAPRRDRRGGPGRGRRAARGRRRPAPALRAGHVEF